MFEDKINTFYFTQDDSDSKSRSVINYKPDVVSHDIFFYASIFKPTKPNLHVRINLKSEGFTTNSDDYISVDSVVKSKKAFFLTLHALPFKDFVTTDNLDIKATLTLFEQTESDGEPVYTELDSKTAYCSLIKTEE